MFFCNNRKFTFVSPIRHINCCSLTFLKGWLQTQLTHPIFLTPWVVMGLLPEAASRVVFRGWSCWGHSAKTHPLPSNCLLSIAHQRFKIKSEVSTHFIFFFYLLSNAHVLMEKSRIVRHFAFSKILFLTDNYICISLFSLPMQFPYRWNVLFRIRPFPSRKALESYIESYSCLLLPVPWATFLKDPC